MKEIARKAVVAVAAVGAIVAVYSLFIRPWHLHWGTTEEEVIESLPGDDIKSDPAVQVTHAIRIDAPATEVWKWLVQIGQGRGGFFSYDWIENLFGLGIHNVDSIVPELQGLQVGDFIRSAHKGWQGGKFDDTAGWFVAELTANQSFVLRDEIEGGSWAFVLCPTNENHTRLVIRVRGPEATTLERKLLHFSFLEPAHFIMERKMLLTLKQLAEKRS